MTLGSQQEPSAPPSNAAQPRWGIVATVKAPATDILTFAAHHLALGAHRLFLYLDAPCPEALPHLKSHPKIRVIETTAAHWEKRRRNRPGKHQVRQTLNATRAYRRQSKDIDWLAHLDVDEFLWSEPRISDHLRRLPSDCRTVRIRPLEYLAGSDHLFKSRAPKGELTQELYPEFSAALQQGFVSHVQGKIFVRTGLHSDTTPLEFRIHNAFLGDVTNPGQVELSAIDLCHFHARNWDHWLTHYRYRLQQGSYRASLAPARPAVHGGRTLHALLSDIDAREGESGLRRFFDSVCADTPKHRAELTRLGLLRERQLHLTTQICEQFPEFTQTVTK